MADLVWLTRHGNRQDFVDPDWITRAERPFDPGLSPDGIVQARRLGQRMSSEIIDRIYASPFLRTAQTAHYVAEALGLTVYLEPGLSEWLNPEWFPARPQTRPAEMLAEEYPRISLDHEPVVIPTYPETEEQAMSRAGRAARILAERHGGALLLVCHSVSVFGAASGLDHEARFSECGLCSLFQFVRNGEGWKMTICGDVSHLYEETAGQQEG